MFAYALSLFSSPPKFSFPVGSGIELLIANSIAGGGRDLKSEMVRSPLFR